MKNKIIVISLMLLCGCVSYKHDTYPNGKQIQIGSYIEDPALSGPH